MVSSTVKGTPRPRRPAKSTPTTWHSARRGTARASRTGKRATKGSRGVASAVRAIR